MKVAIITVSKVEASVLFDAALSNYNICKFLASNATLVTAAKCELINYSVYCCSIYSERVLEAIGCTPSIDSCHSRWPV